MQLLTILINDFKMHLQHFQDLFHFRNYNIPKKSL